MPFQDHFSHVSAAYATYRPSYPPAVAQILASIAPRTELAWEAGCGSGQLSPLLGDRFRRVVATDASLAQIVRSTPHPHVAYGVATAERCPLAEESADLVVAAQAAHWFDLPGWYAEARRVARPDAVVALVGYGFPTLGGRIDAVMEAFQAGDLARFWPPERRHLETGYREIPFPFADIPLPALELTARWTLDELLGYVRTWSAVRALTREGGERRLRGFEAEVAEAWGAPRSTREIRWPLALRAGRLRANEPRP